MYLQFTSLQRSNGTMNLEQFNLVSEEQAQTVFADIFSFFGALSPEGEVLSLAGKVFAKAEINPDMLVGQIFAETVFWQASEFTSAQLIGAIEEAKSGKTARSLLDFRVSATEKIIVELYIYPFYDTEKNLEKLFFCATEVTSRENEIAYYKEKRTFAICS